MTAKITENGKINRGTAYKGLGKDGSSPTTKVI